LMKILQLFVNSDFQFRKNTTQFTHHHSAAFGGGTSEFNSNTQYQQTYGLPVHPAHEPPHPEQLSQPHWPSLWFRHRRTNSQIAVMTAAVTTIATIIFCTIAIYTLPNISNRGSQIPTWHEQCPSRQDSLSTPLSNAPFPKDCPPPHGQSWHSPWC